MNDSLYGFANYLVAMKGKIRLPVILEEALCTTTQLTEFIVVDKNISYNAILGRSIQKEMRVVTSIDHLTMMFQISRGVGVVRGCQYDSRECYNKALQNAEKTTSVF